RPAPSVKNSRGISKELQPHSLVSDRALPFGNRPKRRRAKCFHYSTFPTESKSTPDLPSLVTQSQNRPFWLGGCLHLFPGCTIIITVRSDRKKRQTTIKGRK